MAFLRTAQKGYHFELDFMIENMPFGIWAQDWHYLLSSIMSGDFLAPEHRISNLSCYGDGDPVLAFFSSYHFFWRQSKPQSNHPIAATAVLHRLSKGCPDTVLTCKVKTDK